MFDAELRERKRLRAGGGSVYCGTNWDHTKSCNLCVDSIRPGPVWQHFFSYSSKALGLMGVRVK
jgi:hypothetical protein